MKENVKHIWINSEISESIIGFEVDVFIEALSKYVKVNMSVADTVRYCSKNWADLRLLWADKNGQVVKTHCSLRRTKDEIPGIVALNGDLLVAAEGFPSTKKAIFGNPEWFLAISETAYRMNENGGISDLSDSICDASNRLNVINHKRRKNAA